MGEIIVRKVRGMNWMAKISLVLIFTLVFSTFMYQGFYKPRQAQAAVTVVNAWTNAAQANANASPLTGSFTPGAGANRLVVIAVAAVNSGGNSNYQISGTWGNIPFVGPTTPNRHIASAAVTNSRRSVHLFYMKEADIAARTAQGGSVNNFSITITGTIDGANVFFSTYAGVDQTTPYNAFGKLPEGGQATSMQFTLDGTNPIPYLAGNAYGTYANVQNQNTTAGTIDQSYSRTTGAQTGTNGNYTYLGAVGFGAAAGSTNPTINWGGTSTRAEGVLVTLNPANTSTLTLNNGTNPGNKNVYRKDCNHAVDSFTLQAAGGNVAVSQIVVTGTNMNGNVVKVRIFDDSTGTTANEYDASDTEIGSTTTVTGNSVTVPVTATITSGTTKQFIITYDFSTTIANPTTFTGILGNGSITSNAGTTTYNADTSATLTAQNTTVTVGEGTNPSNKSVQQGSTTPSSNNAVAAFTLTGTPAAAQNDPTVSQIVITGTNVANVAANGVKLWQDTGTTPNEWDAGDTQIGSGVSFAGATATFSGLTIAAPATGATYIVTYDIAVGATVGQTVTGYVSSITSDANTNTNNDNNADATLTIAAGTCTRVAPTVDFGGNGNVMVGNTKQYTLTITNNDSPAVFCSNSTFTLSVFSETGNTGSFTLPSILGSASTGSLAAGATYNTTFTVTAKGTATVGHQLVSTVRATDATNHNALPGSGSVTSTVITAYTNDNLLHNSTNLASSYWAGSWGVPGGKYGAFVCETCHSKSTTNIKRVKTSISTPDSTNWTSTSTPSVSVSFTNFTNATGAMGQDTVHATSNRVCEVCHSQTSVHKYNQPSGATHNGVVDCTTCHKHNLAFAGDGPCLSCHNAAQNVLYNTRNVSTDFTRLSRHVSNGTATSIVTNYDCVVCHAEGDATKVAAGTGWLDKTKHKNGTTANGTVATDRMVKLRNVDNITQSFNFSKNVLPTANANATAAQKEQMRTDFDTFCLNCHDADGASGLDVNGTTGLSVPAASGTTPFNSSDNLRNGRDGFTTRTAVINVKGQFATGTYTWNANNTTMPGGFTGANYNGNPSTHAVLGPRYSTTNANWTANTWVNHTLRSGQVQNTARETAKLHCSDCHLSESNAHGAANAWHMRMNATANDYTSDSVPDTGNDLRTASARTAVVCYKCHNTSHYGSPGSTQTRWHHYSQEQDWYDGGNFGGPAGSDGHKLGEACLLCHGGQDFGGIHGVSGTYNPATPTFPASGATYTRYRFMPGGWMFWKPGTAGNDNDWNSTTTGTCYFPNSSTWATCSSHGGRNDTGPGASAYARPVRY